MPTAVATTARQRGLGHAMRIQRTAAEPADWKAEIQAIEDEAEREVAREYLRGIWLRIKAAERARAEGTRAAII